MEELYRRLRRQNDEGRCNNEGKMIIDDINEFLKGFLGDNRVFRLRASFRRDFRGKLYVILKKQDREVFI